MTEPNGARLITQIKQYRLIREIGRGGMGAVYEAEDTRDGGRVAVKLLHPWLDAEDKSFRDRFEREAHIAALLRSPYSVRLLDFGVASGHCFLVMEYVEGRTVADEVARGPVDPLFALRIAIDVARALEEASARGIVHRDIKPANILLTGDGRVKVTDFGVARHEGGTGLGLTAAGTFVGTAEYAAPEQVTGEADHRTDIYALGAVLYCMLTGHPPFTGGTPWELLRMHQTAQLPVAPLGHLPDAVVNPIRRCMEKDPRDRYQEPAELAAALERALAVYSRWRESPTTQAAPPSVSVPEATLPPTLVGIERAAAALPPTRGDVAPAAPAGLPPGRSRGRRSRWMVVAAVVSAVAVVLAVALVMNDGGDGNTVMVAPTASATRSSEQSGPGSTAEATASAPVTAPTADLVVARAVPSGSDADLCDFQQGISICETLVYAKNPVLAESWEFLAPGTWTFKLRRGVPFHDGTEFTAADVVSAFEELAKTPNNALGVKSGATTALDSYTVRFGTTSTLGEALLAKFDDVLIPKLGSDRSKHPVGTGPLRFVEYQKYTRLVVQRWERYRNPSSVKTRSISFIYINDAAARAAELLAGRVDLVLGVDPAFSGSLTQTGFVIETCEKLTIAHIPNVSGGCTSSGVRYKDFVKK